MALTADAEGFHNNNNNNNNNNTTCLVVFTMSCETQGYSLKYGIAATILLIHEMYDPAIRIFSYFRSVLNGPIITSLDIYGCALSQGILYFVQRASSMPFFVLFQEFWQDSNIFTTQQFQVHHNSDINEVLTC